MKRIAFGLIRPDGFDPALDASTPSPPWMRANASAIWLRLEFSTHTKRMRFLVAIAVIEQFGSMAARSADGANGFIMQVADAGQIERNSALCRTGSGAISPPISIRWA